MIRTIALRYAKSTETAARLKIQSQSTVPASAGSNPNEYGPKRIFLNQQRHAIAFPRLITQQGRRPDGFDAGVYDSAVRNEE